METLTQEKIDYSQFDMAAEKEANLVPMAQGHADLFGGQLIMAQLAPKPRQMAIVQQKMLALASQRGKDYYYSWEVKTKGGGKQLVEGGTIQLADDLIQAYTNCDVDTREIDKGDHWMIYARFIDKENGTSVTRPYRQRKNQNIGKGFEKSGDNDRALDSMLQIGVSKAIRNVVLHCLSALKTECLAAAKSSLLKRIADNPTGARNGILNLLAELSIPVERVERGIGRKADKWTVPDMAKTWAELNSIKDGFINADDIYPTLGEATEGEPEGNKLDEFEKNGAPVKPDPKPRGGKKADAEPKPTEPPATEKATNAPQATPAPTAAPTTAPSPTPAPESKPAASQPPAQAKVTDIDPETGEVIESGGGAEPPKPKALSRVSVPGEAKMLNFSTHEEAADCIRDRYTGFVSASKNLYAKQVINNNANLIAEIKEQSPAVYANYLADIAG